MSIFNLCWSNHMRFTQFLTSSNLIDKYELIENYTHIWAFETIDHLAALNCTVGNNKWLLPSLVRSPTTCLLQGQCPVPSALNTASTNCISGTWLPSRLLPQLLMLYKSTNPTRALYIVNTYHWYISHRTSPDPANNGPQLRAPSIHHIISYVTRSWSYFMLIRLSNISWAGDGPRPFIWNKSAGVIG